MKSKHKEFEDRDFTGGGIYGLPYHHGSTGIEEIDKRVIDLVHDWDCGRFDDLISELLITALNIGHDDIGAGELKLMNRSLKEMRAANQVFRPYGEFRKVVVYGSARTTPEKPEAQAAVEFSRKMVEHGCMVITGAGDGIMGAAQSGAGRENSFGLNIKLPFEQGANETIIGDDKLVTFNYFFTRKLTFVKESDAVALFPGGFGTMDELFESLTLMQTGKAAIFPIVMVDAPGGSYWKTLMQFLREHILRLGLISEEDLDFIAVTDDVDEAVEEVLRFYRVFHSYRYVGKKLIFRLKNKLTAAAISKLSEEFSDIVTDGELIQGKALEAEANEDAIMDLPRLVFTPSRFAFGRYRHFIDAINESELEGDAPSSP